MTYYVLVLVIFLPSISDYYGIHLMIITFLFGMSGYSLIQTFMCSPGKVTTDLIEQIKLNLKVDMPHNNDESIDLDATGDDSTRESKQKLVLCNELNRLLLKYHSSPSRIKDFENTLTHGENNSITEGSNADNQLPVICQFKICDKCDQLQPPRCYHCEVCNCCVLRMDHHCFWMGNCIGLYNFKSFTLYLFYMMNVTGYISLMMTNVFTIDAIELIELMFYSLNLTAVTFLSFGLYFCMLILFLINIKLIWANQTSYEMQLEFYKKPYKMEKFQSNLKEMFGFEYLWEIFVPTKPQTREYSEIIIPRNL
eukprot:403348294